MINDEEQIQEKKPMPFWMVCLVIIMADIIGLLVVYGLSLNEQKLTVPTEPMETCSNFETDIMIDDKPIIYLYPTEEITVSVKLGCPDKLTCVYPEYNDGWNVLAKPNGDLIDLNTGRYQYSLYYECVNSVPLEVNDTGFVVASEDVASFLEEKLAILGLTEREANEFIIYWLPKLESNKYNFIQFATYDEINKNMPLEIEPQPDSIIRVLMLYKGLDEPVEVEEQILETPERTGFTVVEWGGVEFKKETKYHNKEFFWV